MEARFAIPDSTLTVPNYRVGNFSFLKNNNLNFLKIFEKITKNVISQLQRIEQSYLEARFAIFESTLTGPNYRDGNFKFCKLFCYLKFLKILEKMSKIVVSGQLK